MLWSNPKNKMRLQRDYLSVIGGFFNWFSSRFKPLTVHTEAIMIDEVWGKIKEEVRKKRVFKWYVMTPANLDYFKSEFNIRLPKKKLSDIMGDRYRWLIKNKQKLELHVHLSLMIDSMSYKEQEKLIKESIDWIKKELGISIKEFVPGWWFYNRDTLKICEKFGLKMIRRRDYDFIHDYDWVLH